ncbi:hypothetical protein [Cupriavidus basilensis]|uniref:hypothetical protein n=1 Tax=Cupriavidus basilensis TaxID=68895 RepID=UPI0020A65FAF|nr:hypothetical protein [Cupriavidus basilensis]MCP3018297.1 hypothetical protein [Cupriavidus basilensis]
MKAQAIEQAAKPFGDADMIREATHTKVNLGPLDSAGEDFKAAAQSKARATTTAVGQQLSTYSTLAQPPPAAWYKNEISTAHDCRRHLATRE